MNIGFFLLVGVLMLDVASSANDKDRIDKLEKTIESISRQMMRQQLYVEERIRSDGDSGIKQIRVNNGGTRPYFVPHHTGSATAAMHDHANHERTVGMGEFVAVLNGVEFRTRHNDYTLSMPHATSTQYHKIQDIPQPPVPPEVLSQRTVQGQIKEMRQWFKAFKKQDRKHRDYTKYFKPVLCYLEGSWFKDTKEVEESFPSDRHHLGANTWQELEDKIRYTAYTGRKDRLENLAYLPRVIAGVEKDGSPVFAQWNYRILCHPLKQDLPLKYFRLADDLAPRISRHQTYRNMPNWRSARFKLQDDQGNHLTGQERIDKLMSQIPGKNNYNNFIEDTSFEEFAEDINYTNHTTLNAGYYHRYYKIRVPGAMGLQKQHRGFSDQNLFVAFNTQEQVTGSTLTYCQELECKENYSKVSYAIPLEIIYLTPLANWNPYNLTHKGEADSKEGLTVTAENRNGGLTLHKAYNGTNSKHFYRTPAEFFTGDVRFASPADTAKGAVGVLDSQRKIKKVRASGIRIFLPQIDGVGIIRQRYPIMPVHAEGSAVWKELEALKDTVLEMKKYRWMYRYTLYFLLNYHKPQNFASVKNSNIIELQLQKSHSTLVEDHSHVIHLTKMEDDLLRKGSKVMKYTSESNSHNHQVELVYKAGEVGKYVIVSCDGSPKCWDAHSLILKQLKTL